MEKSKTKAGAFKKATSRGSLFYQGTFQERISWGHFRCPEHLNKKEKSGRKNLKLSPNAKTVLQNKRYISLLYKRKSHW